MRTLRLAACFILFAQLAFAGWEEVAPGVEYRFFIREGMEAHVARVDLTSSEIKVISTPESERGYRVSRFAEKHDAIVAINGDYFNDKLVPIGLAIGPCGQWSETRDTKREGFIAIGENRADIYRQSSVIDPPPDWMKQVVSGWPMLVKDCTALTAKELPGSDHFTRAPHPRTAVGLSRDRKRLFLVVADGRRPGVPGLTLSQLARFFRKDLDACSAINLDGGGSSEMVLLGKIINKPSDGAERKVANHLAVVPGDSEVECPTVEAAGGGR